MFRRVSIRTGLVLTLSVVLGGCATIFSGTSDTITFESQPSGAMVVVEGIDRGRTPLTTSVKRSISGADVLYRLDGYETRAFELGQEFETTTILGIFCFPLCPVVDAVTGAMMKYDPITYSLELRPSGSLEEALDVEEVLFVHELERDALGATVPGQIRPNVALVDSNTRQILIFR